MKNPPARSKEATHDRIVDAASRAIRRSGYNGTGVADIMKAAGLTHGGFYAHFASREAMLAEAADSAGSEAVVLMERVAAAVPPQQALQAMLQASQELDIAVAGMAMGALGAVSRLAGGEFGSALTFAVGQAASAPGQMPVRELRAALAALKAAS